MNVESTQKGFTLIELMIVVAIIGILASIAIPQFGAFRVKAFNAAAAADLKNGVTTMEAAFNDNYTYPVEVAAASTTSLSLGSYSWSASDGVTIANLASTVSTYTLCSQHISGDVKYLQANGSTKATESAVTPGTALTGC